MLFEIVLGVLGAMIGVMIAAWAYGLSAHNGGWTDVFWTFGSGLALMFATLWASDGLPTPRQWLVGGLMLVWTLRLGLYLAPRVANYPEDPRYAAFRLRWRRKYRWNMLWVTVPHAFPTALLSLSVVLAATRPGPLDARDAAAVAIFLVAIVGETLADHQMKRFRADPDNRGRVIETGLWGWSRHPNYFFQWLGWIAYPVMALEPARPLTWLSLTAPVVMYVLLRYVSGVPPLEAAMLKSRGETFHDYQRRVSVFFPLPPRRAEPA